MSSSRFLSLLIFIIGVSGILFWAISQFHVVMESYDGINCGVSIMGLYGLTTIGLVLVAIISTLLNAYAFRTTPKPRSKFRITELIVVASPILIAPVLLVIFLFF